MIRQYEADSLEQLAAIASAITATIPRGAVIALYGDLGAGKTTLTSAIVTALGSDDHVSSPTFSIINSYRTAKGDLHHIDLYRLKDVHEALDIGIEDYLAPVLYTVIEWPQIIEEILPLSYYELRISLSGSKRVISLALAE